MDRYGSLRLRKWWRIRFPQASSSLRHHRWTKHNLATSIKPHEMTIRLELTERHWPYDRGRRHSSQPGWNVAAAGLYLTNSLELQWAAKDVPLNHWLWTSLPVKQPSTYQHQPSINHRITINWPSNNNQFPINNHPFVGSSRVEQEPWCLKSGRWGTYRPSSAHVSTKGWPDPTLSIMAFTQCLWMTRSSSLAITQRQPHWCTLYTGHARNGHGNARCKMRRHAQQFSSFQLRSSLMAWHESNDLNHSEAGWQVAWTSTEWLMIV